MNRSSYVFSVISIGDELLIGQVVNTNASWLGDYLSANGFKLNKVLSIGDSESEILDGLRWGLGSDLVLVTGGLGPTADDITKPTVCRFFDTELVFCEDAYRNVENIFRLRGYPMSERNRNQAYIPKASIYIPNRFGTAPCMWLEKDNTIFVFMPGVPFEMKGIMNEEIMPRLKQRFDAVPYQKRMVMTTGIGESFLADRIKEWERDLPSFLSLAYLPQHGMVRLRLSGSHHDVSFLSKTLDQELIKLLPLIGDHVFSVGECSIESVVFEMLRNDGLTLCTAESCTGGNIAHRITLIPGSSSVFKGAVVSYATEVKINVLGVPAQLVDEKGVVSREVVEAMAEGARRLMNADLAIATTGVAGPDGGTDEIPVGTVWIGLATEKQTISKCFNFGNARENVIERSSIAAFDMIRRWLDAR